MECIYCLSDLTTTASGFNLVVERVNSPLCTFNGKGMKASHLIRDAFNLASDAVKNRKPKPASPLPSVEELDQRFNEIYSKRPKSGPESEISGDLTQKNRNRPHFQAILAIDRLTLP